MIDHPEIIETPEQQTAVIRLTIPREQIREAMGAGFAELMATVAAQGIGPIGPAFSLHRTMAPDIFDFELGVPVSGPVRAEGRVRASHLPAARVARTIHRGGYEGLAEAWDQLDGWMNANGHTTALPVWERYLVGPSSEPDPARWQTELNHSIG
ncbi:MAG TPA: GyrI-like domain-containing protein [Enhygromyxa sp.]|nr:GyrI-like domain-containing protein [Enhygromyxa sp.]